ncbi:MAG TPA: helix-turn-helix transcriptional regulator, partial [Stellaceae bacterium]
DVGEIVARNLRLMRRERGWSQEKLAHLVGVSRNYIGMIERQGNSPTIAVIEKIAAAFEITPAELLKEKSR